ncbi:MAG: hypothetical protein VYE73_12720 [Acidobacteriota bacterium]|nr:hypothetical protein [Acidobacteriota bacterium]
MGSLIQDLRLALRIVRASPVWSLTIVLVLALGIGGNMAMLGGLVGGPLGVLSTRTMIGMVPVDPPYLFAMYDYRALVYTLALSFLAGAISVSGVVFRTTGIGLFDALRSGSRGGSSRRSARLRALLVGSEVALSTALVIGAVLMVKSFVQERTTDYGYDRDNILTAQVTLSGSAYSDARERAAYLERAVQNLRSLPEIELAGAVDELPVSPNRSAAPDRLDRRLWRGLGVGRGISATHYNPASQP